MSKGYYVGYSIDMLKEIINSKPEEIKNISFFTLRYCNNISDKTGYLDYIELLKIALSKDGLLFKYIDKNIKHKDYVELALLAIKQNPDAIKFVDKYHKDAKLSSEGIIEDSFSILSLDNEFEEFEEYERLSIISKLLKDGLYLEKLNKVQRNDKELVLIAVTQNGLALQYASDKLKNDKKIIEEAIRQTGEAFKYLTDNKGITVSFKNTIILMTSNLGSKDLADGGHTIGFGSHDTPEARKDIVMKAMKKVMKPEFINRIDEIVLFNRLTDDNLRDIIMLEIGKVEKRVNKIGYKLSKDITKGKLVDNIFNAVIKEREYGARPVLREIQRQLEDKLTDYIIDKNPNDGYTFKLKDIYR